MQRNLTRWYAYARWAHEQMLAACDTVAPDVLTRADGSSFGSILGTLEHLYGADWIWMERFHGTSPSAFPAKGTLVTVDDFRAAWGTLLDKRDAFLRTLTAEQLEAPLSYRNMKGEAHSLPLGDVLYHVANHSTYHRGQVMQSIRQAGGTVTSTDYVFWLPKNL
jgi:uncharacterized damage-inducible protein DinB